MGAIPPDSSDSSAETNLVLVVDDDDTFRLVARASLEGAGFRVEEADNGRVGIQRFKETRPDLVLLDIRMPEMDGYETCVALRGLPEGRRVPIVMLTGLYDPESVEKAYEVGASDFISKPVSYPILTHRLQQILRANRTLVDFDALTGLPNRALLTEHLRRALAQARRSRYSAAVLLLDLDDFARVNDTRGPRTGDEILRQVAERLGSLRSTDYVARNCDANHTHTTSQSRSADHGGDEFLVVLPEVHDAEDCALAAKRIRELLARPFRVDGDEVSVTASIGISVYPADGERPLALLSHAEVATNRARDAGGDRYEFFDESLNAKAQRRSTLESELRQAIERGQLDIRYRPRIALQDRGLGCAETAACWESLEDVPPEELVSFAEQTGLAARLGDRLFRTACTHAAEMLREGLPTRGVSVEVPAARLGQDGLASHLARIAGEARVDTGLVEIAVTEEALLADPDAAVAALKALRAKGFTVALDGFGSGVASLTHLERFPLDTLALDPRFVRDLGKDGSDAVVGAMVALGHALRLRVVARGVERPEQLDRLRDLGCDEAQGELFSDHQAYDAFVAWAKSWETAPGSPVMQTVADSLRGPRTER